MKILKLFEEFNFSKWTHNRPPIIISNPEFLTYVIEYLDLNGNFIIGDSQCQYIKNKYNLDDDEISEILNTAKKLGSNFERSETFDSDDTNNIMRFIYDDITHRKQYLRYEIPYYYNISLNSSTVKIVGTTIKIDGANEIKLTSKIKDYKNSIPHGADRPRYFDGD